MTTRAERDMECALEQVYGGTQDIEAGCVLDKLADMGWRLVPAPLPGQVEAFPEVSTRGLGRRRSGVTSVSPLVAVFAEDIAVWARVHAHGDWSVEDPAVQNLAHRLARLVEQSNRAES